MSEATHMTSARRSRLSKLAVLALFSSMPCIVVAGIVYDLLPLRHALVLPHLWLMDYFVNTIWGAHISRSAGLREALTTPALISLTVPPAIVLGIGGAIHIDRSHGRLKGVTLCMTAIGIALACSLLTNPPILRDLGRVRKAVRLIRFERSERQRRENIFAIGVALKRYVDLHDGDLLNANQWCDMLIKGHYLDGQQRLLRLASSRCWPCGLNPKCGPQSPGETVLLFETKPGWNLRGGNDQFIQIHSTAKGIGGYVFCKNGELTFVTADTVEQLVWE